MADATTEMILRIKADVDKAQRDLQGLGREVDGVGKKTKQTGDSFSSGLTPSISKAAVAAGAATAAFALLQKAIGSAIEKETALAQFSQITGVVGQELAAFGDIADELAIQFGTNAVDNIESFKGVLSRLGPDFASSQEAIRMMGGSINTLALASGLEAPAAMDALTTAMLQFGVDLADPIAAAKDAEYMMNVMAAAAKEGAAEVPQLSEALVQVGVTASNLGVSFEETNAALETLATGGKFGAEAGVALRNVMASMTKVSKLASDELAGYGIEAEELGKILTTKGINEAMRFLNGALQEHGTAAQDAALLTALFGKENMAAAQILAGATDQTEKLTLAIGGTNTAQEQAATILQTTSGRWSQVTAKIDVFIEKIGSFLLPAVEGITKVISDLIDSIERTGAGFDALLSGDFGGAWDKFTGAAEESSKATDEVSKSMRKAKPNIDAVKEGLVETEKAATKSSKAVKVTLTEHEKLLKLIQDKYDSGEQAILMKRLFGEPSAQSAANALSLVSQKLDGMRAPLGDIALVTDQPIDWDKIWGAESLATAEEELVKYGDMMKQIGGIIGNSMFGQDGMKSALKASLNMLINYAEAQLLVASAVATLKTIFGDIGGLIAVGTGVVLLEAARAGVASFRTGIDYVPTDAMPAILHKGEAVLKEDEAERYRRGQAPMGSGNKGKKTVIAFSRFESVIEDNHINTARRYA